MKSENLYTRWIMMLSVHTCQLSPEAKNCVFTQEDSFILTTYKMPKTAVTATNEPS